MAPEDEIHDLRLRIIRLESQMAHLYKHLDIAMEDETQTGDDSRIVELIRQGNSLQAAKRSHEIHNTSLAEAQRAVEEMQKRLRE